MLHRATDVNDLRVPPANHLEKLKGDRLGQYSVRINNQWQFVLPGKTVMLTM